MPESKADSLKKIPLFAVVESGCAAALAEATELRNYAADETVFDEGSGGNALYFLLSGEVVIEKQIDNGKFKPLAILGEGEFFGEMAILSGALSQRSARARAVVETSLAEISGQSCWKFWQPTPNLAWLSCAPCWKRPADGCAKHPANWRWSTT